MAVLGLPTTESLTTVQYFASGGICCCLSHAMATPIDVVKTRMQTEGEGGANALECLRDVVATGGPSALLTGFGATSYGYAVQGSLKYSLFETFKAQLVADASADWRLALLVLSAAMAETIASSALTPFEAARIRLVANSAYAESLPGALQRLLRDEGIAPVARSAPVLLSKMVPYTAAQLVSFDVAKETLGLDTLPSAVIAGLVASILSQPGDTLLTLYNSRRAPDGDAASVAGMAREIIAASGPAGLFRGWKPRLAHTASIVVVQLAAYDYLKSALA